MTEPIDKILGDNPGVYEVYTSNTQCWTNELSKFSQGRINDFAPQLI